MCRGMGWTSLTEKPAFEEQFGMKLDPRVHGFLKVKELVIVIPDIAEVVCPRHEHVFLFPAQKLWNERHGKEVSSGTWRMTVSSFRRSYFQRTLKVFQQVNWSQCLQIITTSQWRIPKTLWLVVTEARCCLDHTECYRGSASCCFEPPPCWSLSPKREFLSIYHNVRTKKCHLWRTYRSRWGILSPRRAFTPSFGWQKLFHCACRTWGTWLSSPEPRISFFKLSGVTSTNSAMYWENQLAPVW